MFCGNFTLVHFQWTLMHIFSIYPVIHFFLYYDLWAILTLHPQAVAPPLSPFQESIVVHQSETVRSVKYALELGLICSSINHVRSS